MERFLTNFFSVRFITNQFVVMKHGCTEPNTTNRQGLDGLDSLKVNLGVLVNSSFKRVMELNDDLTVEQIIRIIEGPVVTVTTWVNHGVLLHCNPRTSDVHPAAFMSV
jgi:hypothetical protein